MEYIAVTAEEFATLGGLDDWTFGDDVIQASFSAGSFPGAAALVSRIAEAAEAANHHPDIDVRYPDRVVVMLTTHATGGVTTLDVDVARTVSEIASETRP